MLVQRRTCFYSLTVSQTFLRRLFAEGAFSQAFVPVLAEYQKSGDLSKTREFIGKVSGTLGGLVSVVTLLAWWDHLLWRRSLGWAGLPIG